MKSKVAILSLLLLQCFPLFSQVTNDMPAVTAADLELRQCAFEPDADAMKLYDILETEFEMATMYPFQRTTRKVRIKIFNEKGYKHANVRIPYFSKKGTAKIKNLEATIYNLENGKIKKDMLNRWDFFKDKAADFVGMVNFTYPGLKPGSIIEYSYTTVENNIIYFPPWFIQDEIPVGTTVRIYHAPADTKIFERPIGIDSVDKTLEYVKSDRFQQLTYWRKDVPSFKPEPFMSAEADYLIRLTFHVLPYGGTYKGNRGSSNDVWEAGGKSLLNSYLFTRQVRSVIPGTEKIIDSAKSMPVKKDRIRYIYNRLKSIIPPKVEQTTSAEDLAEAWNNKSGTSSEINLILMNLLLQSEVPCIPLLVSTREHGKVNKDFPSLGQLNGVDILAVDSPSIYLLDASLKYQSFETPPINILNREAFLLSTDSMQWVMITDNRPLLRKSVNIFSDLTEDGKIEGSGTIQYYDYAKTLMLDSSVHEETDKDEKSLDKKEVDLKILSVTRENADMSDEPLTEQVEFVYEPSSDGPFLSINPQILTKRIKSPFVAEKRYTDIDMGCNQQLVLNFQVHLPPGYSVESLPKNILMRAPDSSFLFVANYSADRENIYISQLFETRRAIFSKEEYPGIQDFFSRMYGLMSEEIILKKNK